MSVFARCYSFAGRPRWENYQLILRKSQFYVWNTGLTSQLSKSVFLKFWGAPLPYPPLKCIWRFLAKLVIPKKQSCYLTVVFSLKRKTFLQNVQKKFKNLVHSSEIFKFYCFWWLLRQRKWSKLSKVFFLAFRQLSVGRKFYKVFLSPLQTYGLYLSKNSSGGEVFKLK